MSVGKAHHYAVVVFSVMFVQYNYNTGDSVKRKVPVWGNMNEIF